MKRLAFTVLIALMATSLAAQSPEHDHAMMMNHDAMFADAMTKHHQDGIKMAQVAVDKSTSAELRSMAQKMIDDQRKEIDQMQALRGDAPKMPMQEMENMPGMMPESEMQKDMARLESTTGRDFDLAFTEIMPKHHQGAIRMSGHELDMGTNPEMKEIARGIVEKQTREREQLIAMHERLSGTSQPPRERMTKN